METKRRSQLALILSTLVVIGTVIEGLVTRRFPHFVPMGLATLGTILGQWGVKGVNFPTIGGLLGGFFGTQIELFLYPRMYGGLVLINNLLLALVVSVFVVSWRELFTRNRETAA